MDRATVLYDEDCGFCRWAADRLRAWDRRDRLAFASIQGAEGTRLLASMDPAARLASWHVADPGGTIRSAGDAVPSVLRRLPGGAPLAAVSAAFPRTTQRLYGWTVRHRARLGRMLGQRACAVRP
jgi:predicted DCC family thiol-disulfide oxidoreductase YuxK